MTFRDYHFPEKVAGVSVVVRVATSALHALWGAHSGPQTARELVDANWELFEDIIAEKFARGEMTEGEIAISDCDLDM